MRSEPGERKIFAKFIDDQILGEVGRLFYFALNTFAMNGYGIELFNNFDLPELSKEKHYLSFVGSIKNMIVVTNNPKQSENFIYLFDEEDPLLRTKRWRKKVQIKFDIFSSYRWHSFIKRAPIMMPYPVHPVHYNDELADRLKEAREQPKTVRLLFSGDNKNYKKNRIFYPSAKLPRSDVIETILSDLDAIAMLVRDESALRAMLDYPYTNCCAIVDTSKVYIEDWLNGLAKADFFICPPGFVMPMCHNAVEAMAVGSIPLINYPEWFSPGLEHRKNCIAFTDREDLKKKVKYIVNDIEENRIKEMQKEVILYYEKYLKAEQFVRKVEGRGEAKVIALMITDKYVAKNSSKLHKSSILLRDSVS